MTLRVETGNCTVDIGQGVHFTTCRQDWSVTTKYPDGASSYAERRPTVENMAEARDEGYAGDVWTALVDHELLHTIVSRLLFGHESRVIRHNAGVQLARYGERLYEEAVVLAIQYWLNTRTHDQALVPFIKSLPAIERALIQLKNSIAIARLTDDRF